MHRRLDKNVEQLPLPRPRVDFIIVATLDAKNDLEGVSDGNVTFFIPIGEID